MKGADERMPSAGGILMDFVENAERLPHLSEWLVSFLDVCDLFALRLVSIQTRAWVDAVMSKHRNKVFTLYLNKEKTLKELMDKQFAAGIPFFRRLHIGNPTFFSHPLIPEFIRIYGPQIHTVYHSENHDDVVPEEVAFYQALTNLTQLSTCWLGANVADEKMPALKRLQLLTISSEIYDEHDSETIRNDLMSVISKPDFLPSFPNLTHLWLPPINLIYYEGVLEALGPYFAVRNGWKRSSSAARTLTIFVEPDSIEYYTHVLEETAKEGLVRLLQELAIADGRILLEGMPITLLYEAVRLFQHEPGKLLSFGKCILSLIWYSGCLYEVELPNMRKLDLTWFMNKLSGRNRTVSWPKLEEINLNVGSRYMNRRTEGFRCMSDIVFKNGEQRPSVLRLECNLYLLSVGSNEDHHLLLGNLPNLTHLTLHFEKEDVRLFRSVVRMLPTSCSKIQFLEICVDFDLEDEDFVVVDGEGLQLTTPSLIQFPALKWLKISAYNDDSSSVCITDAVFVNVFSFMQLEYLDFEVFNAMFTAKALAALLEGPFANSILELGYSFEDDEEKHDDSWLCKCLRGARTDEVGGHHYLVLLNQLKARMLENRKKFPWKTLYTRSERRRDGCVDFL